MLSIYSFAIRLYFLAVLLASVWNRKARRFIHGRKGIWNKLEKIASDHASPVWFHCSSLGEFEQGRSLIERIKQENPSIPIILTFFSSSGYEIRKHYPMVDAVCYLPIDTPENARHFIRLLSPRLAVFIKYDFWFNYLFTLRKFAIPFIFVSVRMGNDHFLFRTVFRKLLRIFSQAHHIFTQDQETANILKTNKIKQATVAGDTRVDQVFNISRSEFKKYPPLLKFNQGKTIVLGSIWPEDWDVLRSLFVQNKTTYGLIVASHEVSGSFINELKDDLDPLVYRVSQLPDRPDSQINHILVDTIGDLAYLYRYGDLAYVGGGFGKGIHNILEPAIYGIPVLFGPNYKKFGEAENFIKMGAAKKIETTRDLEMAIQHFESPAIKSMVKKSLSVYFERQRGATDKIFSYLSAERLL